MFGTQLIANNFPLNTRLRRDPGSLGQRLLSIQGDFLEAYMKDLGRFKLGFYPLLSWTDVIPNIYVWNIDDFTFKYEDTEKNLYEKNPSIYGDGNPLTIYSNTENLLNSLPTRIEFFKTINNTDGIVYDSLVSEAATISDIVIPGRLWIEITGVTQFYSVADNTTNKSPALLAKLSLEGEDAYGTTISEVIIPNQNGLYRTKYKYSKLLSLQLINVEGVLGRITIKTLDFNVSLYNSLYTFVSTPQTSHELKIEFDTNFLYLKYPIFQLDDGKRISEDRETFSAALFLGESSNKLDIVDITFQPNNEYLYVLASGSKLYLYKRWYPNQFILPSTERSLEVVAVVEPTTYYSKLDEELQCFLYTRSISKRISYVQVKVVDPDGDVFYLNTDLELQDTPYSFMGDLSDFPADGFSDRVFYLILDKSGQWEIITMCIDINDVEYIDVTCVIVPYLIADLGFDLDTSKEYTSISCAEDGMIYCNYDNSVDVYRLVYDGCIISSADKIVYSLESYSELEVIYE